VIVQKPVQLRLLSRWFIAGLMLLLAIWTTTRSAESDFVQDYAAAVAWLNGQNVNDSTAAILQACCPEVVVHSGIFQTAHPPVATLVSLPFALLPWSVSRLLWLLLGWAMITWFAERLDLDPLAGIATLGAWLFGLGLGAFEPMLYALLAAALLDLRHAPRRAGIWLGLAAALKIYPALLILGLAIGRHYRAFYAAVLAGGAITILAEIVLGAGTTLNWLAYASENARVQVERIENISLIRLLHLGAPWLPLSLGTLMIGLLLALPLYPRLRRGEVVAPLLSVMLLASPIFWSHYVALLAICRPGRLALACIGLGGTLTWAGWIGLLPGDNLAPLGYGSLLLASLLIWYAQVRPLAPAPSPTLPQ
jgi:alpha-1,2-mannosyltransferase